MKIETQPGPLHKLFQLKKPITEDITHILLDTHMHALSPTCQFSF